VQVGAARGLRRGAVEHDGGLIDADDLDTGVEQLPGGRHAGAATEVEHPRARVEPADQPVGLANLDIPLDE
jgi:hypothetical protein